MSAPQSSESGGPSRVTLRQSAAPDGDGTQVPVTVRRVRLMDVPALRVIEQRVPLQLPYTHWQDTDPVRTAISVLAPLVQSRRRLFVARGDGEVLGYAIFTVAPPDQRWTIEALGARTGVYDADPVWEELLRHGVVGAGLEGVKRLYARVPLGSRVLPAVRRIGFTPYASETVLHIPQAPPRPPARSVRAQRPADLWAIHQLYTSVVPRQVQYAEAMTSGCWDVSRRGRPGGYGSQGYIVEDGHLVVAYGRVVSRPDAHVLELLVHPDHRHTAPNLVSTMLANMAAMPTRQVYAVIRSYQQELLPMFQQLGFAVFLEQDVHVKYTTVSTRVPALEAVAFSVEVKEPAGKRVPSFLKGVPGDPTSETAG